MKMLVSLTDCKIRGGIAQSCFDRVLKCLRGLTKSRVKAFSIKITKITDKNKHNTYILCTSFVPIHKILLFMILMTYELPDCLKKSNAPF